MTTSPEAGASQPVIPATERRDLDLAPLAGASEMAPVAHTVQGASHHRKPQRRELSYRVAALAYTWAAIQRRK